jgi:nucleoside-diphosphate-sugar epimerase
MKLLVLGAGNAGLEVASRAKALGWDVTATTTRESRIAEIEQIADKAVVVLGKDRDAVAAAAAGADAILCSVSPPVMAARTIEERAQSYQDVLVETCLSAAAANPRSVFMSSISVYGDGLQGEGDQITEDMPRADIDEPSTVYFSAAEDAILANPQGTVLRLADIYGHPRDINFTERVKMAHQYMGGSVAFAGEGRLHRVHVGDVAQALLHVLQNDLYGVYNCVPDLAPSPSNADAFNRLADAAGVERLEFRGELRTPMKQVSSAKLRATGFTFEHPDDEIL